MDCVAQGWNLLTADFVNTWVIGLVTFLLLCVMGCALIAAPLLIPPLMAGLYLAVRRRIDGGPLEIGDLFSGFRERYWHAVASALPPILAGLVALVLMGAAVVAGLAVMGVFSPGGTHHGHILAGILVMAGPILLLQLGLSVFCLFFTFVMAAVWDHPESVFEGARVSIRLVKAHFWPTVGFALVFLGIQIAANLIGQFTFGLGALVAAPLVVVWEAASTIYLYRAWTGQALVQASIEGITV
jgi:hypothetical protein